MAAVARIRRVLVLGGGSEIARATVLELLREGPLDVVLAARRPDELETAELEAAGAAVERIEFDARATSTHEQALEPVFAGGDVDLVLLAFGVLGDQSVAERDAASAVEIADTNFTGAVSALTIVASFLRRQGRGTIVVLSSAAAQRPRASNYVYGASKAGLDAFVRGMQLSSAETGVRILLVRPGFVRTAMTAGLRSAPLAVGPERVAAEIVAALRRDVDVVWVPRALRAAMWIVLALPRSLVRRL
ncbi:MAG TPA: SDR family NAD(P)-dependent oxidoreductase [Gaiellaceae bacterium]|nr:SDR family NAD(P)-dependent oxidoreductase [Gaiellaceae bacterium]